LVGGKSGKSAWMGDIASTVDVSSGGTSTNMWSGGSKSGKSESVEGSSHMGSKSGGSSSWNGGSKSGRVRRRF
jgi:hypothetical protein